MQESGNSDRIILACNVLHLGDQTQAMKLHLLSLVALHAVAADTYDDIVARCAKTVEEAGITPDECSPGPPGLRPGQLASTAG